MDTRPLGNGEQLVGGRYRIVGPAGSGGIAHVYRAEDTRLGRPVALKQLKDDFRKVATFSERFEREARLASAVRHPSCAQVLDFGWDDARAPYLVMEWIDGRCLFDEVNRTGGFDLERTVRLFGQVCDALSAVHEARVVHRDVKPENILLVAAGTKAEHVKLIDFGIARSLDPSTSPPLTQAHARIGSPEYMAPEHILGEACDERSDVYCAAALLFFMLTGRPPYSGGAQAMMMQHLNAKVPRLPLSVAVLQPVIDRGLSKTRGERFSGAAELKTAAENALRPSEAVKPSRRVPFALVAAVIAVAAVVGVTVPEWKTSKSYPVPTSTRTNQLSWAEAEARGREAATRLGYEVVGSEVRGAKTGFEVVLNASRNGTPVTLVATLAPEGGEARLELVSDR